MDNSHEIGRAGLICTNELWLEAMDKIDRAEVNRKFCRHGISHLLDVARLAYIEVLENNYSISKETVYAAALLHDIGRAKDNADHEAAGAEMADRILNSCGFSDEESAEIAYAVRQHGNAGISAESSLCGLLYRADKRSRICCFCSAVSECYWSDEKKNMHIKG